jgi:hypothetical protein
MNGLLADESAAWLAEESSTMQEAGKEGRL